MPTPVTLYVRLRRAAAEIRDKRQPGYLAAAESAAHEKDDETLHIAASVWRDLEAKFPAPNQKPRKPPSGPGTELKALLARIGIHASPTCGCNAMAQKMDRWGPKESLNHIEEIVDVMEQTAKKRNLPFLRTAGRILVRQACRIAKKKGNGK